MKKITRQLCLYGMSVFLLLLNCIYLKAEVKTKTNEKVMHAVGVLKGIYEDYPKNVAVDVLQKAAEQDTMAYAMNVLGLAYMEGIGVDKNAENALHWLNMAAKNGFYEAYHNIGTIYKNGKCGVKQDFNKAYSAFAEGAITASTTCKYDAGFMLYKGLGCNQNYEKAKELFESAVSEGHSGAMYMLGLCYRNGYGVERDEEKAMLYLNQSADLGYAAAIEELSRPTPENCLHDIFTNDELYSKLPSSMPDINVNINDTTLFKGHYEGYIVMYDWSGKYVLGEKPVYMSINRNETEGYGLLVLGTDSIPFSAEYQTDGSLKFKKSYVQLNERYNSIGKVSYKLDKADLDIWNGKIRGALSLYSMKLREPERPMYMELYNENYNPETDGDESGRNSHITISPNPFDYEFSALFELNQGAFATARIFDKYGIAIWKKDLGFIEQGKNKITLTPNLNSGYFVLNISAGKQVLRTIIVKK